MATILRTLVFLLLALLLIGVLAVAAGFVLRELDLYPPDNISIAAGSPGSAYHEYATAYGRVLARDGIELTILETRGSVENAELLAREDGADIALVQGGVPLGESMQGLAALFVEPLWLFGNAAASEEPSQWAGLRIAAGSQGSGTRLVADELARITGARGFEAGVASAAGGAEAAEALLAGEIDVALFVAPVGAPYLSTLLESRDVRLFSLARSESVALRLSGARLVRMPAGILDYERPLPEKDLRKVALVARLVARNDIHPALVNRLIHAVKEVHSNRKIIPDDKLYPASRDLDAPPNDYAAQLLQDGFSSLERILPYWIVAQFNRVLLVLLPAIFLLLPLLRLVPTVYQSILKRRVFRHYSRVHAIDNKLARDGATISGDELEALETELDEIEQRLLRTNLPNSYRKQAYTLLHHLDFVRRRARDIAQRAAE